MFGSWITLMVLGSVVWGYLKFCTPEVADLRVEQSEGKYTLTDHRQEDLRSGLVMAAGGLPRWGYVTIYQKQWFDTLEEARVAYVKLFPGAKVKVNVQIITKPSAACRVKNAFYNWLHKEC